MGEGVFRRWYNAAAAKVLLRYDAAERCSDIVVLSCCGAVEQWSGEMGLWSSGTMQQWGSGAVRQWAGVVGAGNAERVGVGWERKGAYSRGVLYSYRSSLPYDDYPLGKSQRESIGLAADDQRRVK